MRVPVVSDKITSIASLSIFCLWMLMASNGQGSEPIFDGVDYSNPKKYLSIHASLGDVDRISQLAKTLRRETDEKTIQSVLSWMESNLAYDGKLAYEWRNFDTVMKSGCYGGCADHGIVCGVLLKAAGIPTVWVKTMDVDWIWDFKQERPFKAWSGHVFLEIFVDGKWVLLDPGAKLIYADYSPTARILPGRRFAYHKGDNPKKMVMSLQWEAWKQQTCEYFRDLDPALLPVDEKGAVLAVPKVFVVGNDPYYKIMTEMAQKKGMSVARSFNSEYGRFLPEAKGHVLLIETHGGKPILPIESLEKHFPGACSALNTGIPTVEIGHTRIVFVEFDRLLDALHDDSSNGVPTGYSRGIGNSHRTRKIPSTEALLALQVQEKSGGEERPSSTRATLVNRQLPDDSNWMTAPQICRGRPHSSTANSVAWKVDENQNAMVAAATDGPMETSLLPKAGADFSVSLVMRIDGDGSSRFTVDNLSFELQISRSRHCMSYAGQQYTIQPSMKSDGWTELRLTRRHGKSLLHANGKELIDLGNAVVARKQISVSATRGTIAVKHFSLTGDLTLSTAHR